MDEALLKVLFVLVFFSPSILADIPNECDKDEDCGRGLYCLLGNCEHCIPCEQLYHRRSKLSPSSSEVVCSKIEDDCGICLQGYHAEDLVNQGRSMKCHALAESFTSKTSTDSSVTTAMIIASLGMLVLFVTMAIFAYFPNIFKGIWSLRSSLPHSQRDAEMPSAPPLELLAGSQQGFDQLEHAMGSASIDEGLLLLTDQRSNLAHV